MHVDGYMYGAKASRASSTAPCGKNRSRRDGTAGRTWKASTSGGEW